MGNQSSTSCSSSSAISHASSKRGLKKGITIRMSIPLSIKNKTKSKRAPRMTYSKDSTRLDETCGDSVSSCISGNRSLPSSSKSCPPKIRTGNSLFPFSSMGRRRCSPRSETEIDKDLDSIIAFIKKVQANDGGQAKLENLVVKQMKNPNESPSTELFLAQCQGGPNRKKLHGCQSR